MNIHLILLALWIVAVSAQTRARKEFRDMSLAEWRRFKRTLAKMNFYTWSAAHNAAAMDAHNNPQFLPWHRAFLYQFEDELRKIDPRVTIPYWDWTFDASDPLSSPIFKREYLGIVPSLPPSLDDGSSPPPSRCLYFRDYPEPHCLKRYYNASDFGTFYHQDTISAIVYAANLHYDQFRVLLEVGPHGIVHVLVGGDPIADMSTMASPNDPFFWLHHAFIDYLWAQWQGLNDPFAYDGFINDVAVSLDDTLRPFGTPVSTWMNMTLLEYYYEPFSGWNNVAAPTAAHSPSRLSEAWMNQNHLSARLVTETHNKLMELLLNGSDPSEWPRKMKMIPSVV